MRVSTSCLLSTRIGKNALLIEQKQTNSNQPSPRCIPWYRGLFLSARKGGVDIRRRGSGCILGVASIVIGVLIILAMVLPSGFWWLILGAALIVAGLFLLRSF